MTRGHYPTEKPVGLLKVMIEQSSHTGELVLDPFCGSGSTGRAARELGRRAVLCDLDASSAAAALRVASRTPGGAGSDTKWEDVGQGFVRYPALGDSEDDGVLVRIRAPVGILGWFPLGR